MLFLIRCIDKPGYTPIRTESRPRHLDYMDGFKDHVRFAGPILNDKTESPMGSVFILEFTDRGEAERFAADDPYAKAGLFASVEIAQVRQTIPAEV